LNTTILQATRLRWQNTEEALAQSLEFQKKQVAAMVKIMEDEKARPGLRIRAAEVLERIKEGVRGELRHLDELGVKQREIGGKSGRTADELLDLLAGAEVHVVRDAEQVGDAEARRDEGTDAGKGDSGSSEAD